MKDGNNNIVRTYLMIFCPLGTPAEKKLNFFSVDLDSTEKLLLYTKVFQGKGSSNYPPYFAYEIGFNQKVYDYDQFISNMECLFNSISRNKNRINDIMFLDDTQATFAIIFNCQNINQKPVLDLNDGQLKLLGEIKASLSLESYFEF